MMESPAATGWKVVFALSEPPAIDTGETTVPTAGVLLVKVIESELPPASAWVETNTLFESSSAVDTVTVLSGPATEVVNWNPNPKGPLITTAEGAKVTVPVFGLYPGAVAV